MSGGCFSLSRMGRVPGRVRFAGLIGASGVGTYLGTAVAGLVAVLSGQVLAQGSSWPAAAVMLAVLGAGAGAVIAGLTRVARTLRRRTLILTAGGLVSLPLATAINHLDQVDSIGIGLVGLGGVVGVIVYVRGRRRWPPGQVFEQSVRVRG